MSTKEKEPETSEGETSEEEQEQEQAEVASSVSFCGNCHHKKNQFLGKNHRHQVVHQCPRKCPGWRSCPTKYLNGHP